MAITDAQQAKQIMMKKGGKVSMQGGVKNYLGKQPEVQAPRKWQSAPDKPPTELAYITEAEKDLILKADIHGSLSKGPNMGPSGIMSLDSFGDAGGGGAAGVDTSAGGGAKEDRFEARSYNPGMSQNEVNRQRQIQEDRAKQMQKEARETRRRMEEKKQQDIKNALDPIDPRSGKRRSEMTPAQRTAFDKYMQEELEDSAEYKDYMANLKSPDVALPPGVAPKQVTSDLYQEKIDDIFMGGSGAKQEAFFNDPRRTDKGGLPVIGPTSLVLNMLKGPLEKGAVQTRKFFAGPTTDIFGRKQKGVLQAGRLKYKGNVVTPEAFNKLSLSQQNEIYKDYMSNRLAGKTDAYGNLASGYMRDGSGNIISTGNDRDSQQPVIPPIAQQPKDDDAEEEDFQLALAFRADGGRVPYEDGGITTLEEAKRMAPPGESLAYINDDEAALLKSLGGAGEDVNGTGIKSYFIKKIFRGAKKAVKKIVKSPIGKAAILGAAAFGIPGTGFSGIGGGLGSLLKGKKFSTLFSGIGDKIAGASVGKLAGLSIGGGLLAGALAGKGYEDEDEDGFDDNTGFSVEEYRRRGAQGNVPIAFRAEGGMSDVENDPQYKGWKRIYEVNPDAAEMHPKHKEFVKYYANIERQGKEEGGLMDLKGMEMDFRDEGGFVPIGKKERADDVPARLSKNEFVMTADAVRGAGDGNIDKGAEKMYNLMSKLEAENDQSQGLDGAREMFKTAQRLEEVL